MKEKKLSLGWRLLQIPPQEHLDIEQIKKEEQWMEIPQMPAQVQDVLLFHKKIPKEFLVGWCQEVNWITEYDWVYSLKFFCG